MNVFFSEGLRAIEKAFNAERMELSNCIKQGLLEIFSKIGIYEEEETKILPKILIGRNLKSIFHQIPDHFKIVLGTDDQEGLHIKKMLKALIPLCKNGWYVYMDFNDNKIDYGIFRKFCSPVSFDFEQLIFGAKEMYITDNKIGLICIQPVSRLSFILKCLHTEDIVISSNFINDYEEQKDEKYYKMMISDLLNKVVIDKKIYEYVENAMNHLFQAFSEQIHGAIALIVDEKYCYPNEYLNGLKIKPPINLINNIIEAQAVESYEIAERYYAVSNLLYEFLNVDGITIMNNKGEISGYNAFYRSSSTPIDVEGGARKRTFEGLQQIDDNQIIGVYYQSQDGNKKYIRRKIHE